jgi:hypothetical protein
VKAMDLEKRQLMHLEKLIHDSQKLKKALKELEYRCAA